MLKNYGYQNEINVFNEAINKTRIIIDMTERFIIRVEILTTI